MGQPITAFPIRQLADAGLILRPDTPCTGLRLRRRLKLPTADWYCLLT
jgi:hypothetical protein